MVFAGPASDRSRIPDCQLRMKFWSFLVSFILSPLLNLFALCGRLQRGLVGGFLNFFAVAFCWLQRHAPFFCS